MRAIVSALAAALLSGCSAHSAVAISTGGYSATAVPLGSSSAYYSSVNVTATSSSAWGVVAGAALLAYLLHGADGARWEENRGLVLRESVPELAPDRVVHEQDCSRPIENPTANLRCR